MAVYIDGKQITCDVCGSEEVVSWKRNVKLCRECLHKPTVDIPNSIV